ncbi:hypothetical protein ACFODZ_15635 [Marinicella sediminis]|uniref:Fibronectin type III domain-containing protein n=1 Tax=Marinicella sediminis TaxID=1792834 RepID=A0ABV7JG72_9GAMM|nr:hypothetical protein [Marinicella sediminis]
MKGHGRLLGLLCVLLLSLVACAQKHSAFTLKWKTASEVNNLGYNVYRAELEAGPFKQINSQIIQGAGTTDLISQYSYTDETVRKRQVYYYYIESVSENGQKKRFTPVLKSNAKNSP